MKEAAATDQMGTRKGEKLPADRELYSDSHECNHGFFTGAWVAAAI